MRGLSQGAFSILWLLVIEALNPVSTAHAVILEYPYKGDFANYISRFNDEVSQTAFEESLFLNIDGCTAVTLQNGSVLILVIDGSLGSIVYSVVEPDASDELEICGFGNYHGAGGGLAWKARRAALWTMAMEPSFWIVHSLPCWSVTAFDAGLSPPGRVQLLP